MPTPSHLRRQILAGSGTPAPALADALGISVLTVWAEREADRRCAHLGEPLSIERELDEEAGAAFFDAFMRSNRSVCG